MPPSSLDQLLELADSAFELVRKGSLEEGAEVIDAIRKRVSIENIPQLAVDVFFVEVTIAAYKNNWSAANDRLMRSLAICNARNDFSRTLRSQAWLSFVQFNSDFLLDSAKTAATVLADKRLVDPATRFRAAVVLASLAQYSDMGELANKWFSIARRSADLARDRSLTSVAIFNSVLTRVAAERFNRHIMISARDDLDLALMFANSAESFDSYGGISLNAPFHALVKSHIRVLQGDYAGALEIINPLLSEKSLGEDNIASLHIERLDCLVKASPSGVSRDYILEVQSLIPSLSGDDEIAIALSVLADSFGLVGLIDQSIECREASTDASRRFIDLRSSLANEVRNCDELIELA